MHDCLKSAPNVKRKNLLRPFSKIVTKTKNNLWHTKKVGHHHLGMGSCTRLSLLTKMFARWDYDSPFCQKVKITTLVNGTSGSMKKCQTKFNVSVLSAPTNCSKWPKSAFAALSEFLRTCPVFSSKHANQKKVGVFFRRQNLTTQSCFVVVISWNALHVTAREWAQGVSVGSKIRPKSCSTKQTWPDMLLFESISGKKGLPPTILGGYAH